MLFLNKGIQFFCRFRGHRITTRNFVFFLQENKKHKEKTQGQTTEEGNHNGVKCRKMMLQ